MAPLVRDNEWAVGHRFGQGDIAVGTALGYLTVLCAECDWRSLYPALPTFSDRTQQRPFPGVNLDATVRH